MQRLNSSLQSYGLESDKKQLLSASRYRASTVACASGICSSHHMQSGHYVCHGAMPLTNVPHRKQVLRKLNCCNRSSSCQDSKRCFLGYARCYGQQTLFGMGQQTCSTRHSLHTPTFAAWLTTTGLTNCSLWESTLSHIHMPKETVRHELSNTLP